MLHGSRLVDGRKILRLAGSDLGTVENGADDEHREEEKDEAGYNAAYDRAYGFGSHDISS